MNYFNECNFATTICDLNGTIVYMNEKAKKVFEKWGGEALIGKSLYDCHSDDSQDKIKNLLKTGNENSYTIEKKGINKIIHQTPWFKEGKIAGLIEISIEIPEKMPHFKR